jgi:hypothetical protein
VLLLGVLASSTASRAAVQPRRVAVIVGANVAAAGRAPLRYSHDDARSVAEVLTEVGGFEKSDTTVLLDPQPEEVLAVLDRQLGELAGLPQGSLLLFYYSGHADSGALYPAGKALSIVELRARLESPSATVRVGLLDACRGGGWTRAKGLEPDAPFEVEQPLGLTSEGSVMVASSSGLESAHESSSLQGSFFTHHLLAGLRGAADQSGDGEVTVAEAFAYAKELTIRDSMLQAGMAQHPSFDMKLRGRSELTLTRAASSGTRVELVQTKGPLQVIQLSSGLVVAEVSPGKRTIVVAVRPGRFLVRRRLNDGTFAREVSVEANHPTMVSEETLELVGSPPLAAKGADDTPYSTATTVRRGYFQLDTWVGTVRGRSPSASVSIRDLFTGARVVVGLTDRLEWDIPYPALAYRFGDRGGVEVITGFAFHPSVVWCGDPAALNCVKAVYVAGVGAAVRWWQSGHLALNGNVTVGHGGDFTGKLPFDLGGSVLVGFSFTAYDLLTVNFGVGLDVATIGPQAFERGDLSLVIGSGQISGLRSLPLLQLHVLPKLAINGDLQLIENLKTGVLLAAFEGGFSWTF